MSLHELVLNQIKIALQAKNAPPELVADFVALKPEQIETFVFAIDDSDFSIEEWIDALLLFREWEVSHQRKLELTNKIDYLACCAQGVAQLPKLLPFVELVRDYLKNYGVSKD